MILKDYYRAQSIDEVVALLSKSKKNIVLGGCHWLGLNTATYNLGIDISGLGLGVITDEEDEIVIGADVSLHQIETDPLIGKYAGVLVEAVKSIVGVQFRNTARIGASVYSRFGFSDITAALLTLDAFVEIDGDRKVTMAEYVTMPRKRHFLTRIVIKKENIQYIYQTMRRNKTDLPYLILAMSRSHQDLWRIVVGARPGKSVLASKTMAYLGQGGSNLDHACDLLLDEVAFADNIYASQAYRQHLIQVFLERGLEKLWK